MTAESVTPRMRKWMEILVAPELYKTMWNFSVIVTALHHSVKFSLRYDKYARHYLQINQK